MARPISKQSLLKKYPTGCKELTLDQLEAFHVQSKEKDTGRFSVLIPTSFYTMDEIVAHGSGFPGVVERDVLHKSTFKALHNNGWGMQELIPARINAECEIQFFIEVDFDWTVFA